MGNLELWLYKPSELLKKKHWKTHLCKTLCSLEKKKVPQVLVFPKCGHQMCQKLRNWITKNHWCQTRCYKQPSISLEPNATFWFAQKIFPKWLMSRISNLMQLDCTAQRPTLWMFQVQNLVTKTRPQTQISQHIIANYSTVSKWQPPQFLPKRVSRAVHRRFIKCHWKSPLLTTNCFCESGSPGHEQCEAVQLWSLDLDTIIHRSCHATWSPSGHLLESISQRSSKILARNCWTPTVASRKATCWMRSQLHLSTFESEQIQVNKKVRDQGRKN